MMMVILYDEEKNRDDCDDRLSLHCVSTEQLRKFGVFL